MTGQTLKGCRPLCPTCDEYMDSERAFDRHRLGDFAIPGEWRRNRRCLIAVETDAAGWARSGDDFLLDPDPRPTREGVQGLSVAQPATQVRRAP